MILVSHRLYCLLIPVVPKEIQTRELVLETGTGVWTQTDVILDHIPDVPKARKEAKLN